MRWSHKVPSQLHNKNCIHDIMTNCEFMKSLPTFQSYMTSNEVPNYVIRYCSQLDRRKWQWFYKQMQEAMEYIGDIGRFFYILKWILKYDFDDLTYEVFFQDYTDPEMCCDTLIKEEWREFLNEKYNDRLIGFFSDIMGGAVS